MLIPPERRLLMLAFLSAAWMSSTAHSAAETTATGVPSRMMESTLTSMVDAAMDDAARHTKLDRSRLEVVSAEHVTWTDGSLGCPQPDMLYTQALVPGYRIRIKAGDEVLDYHAGRRGKPVLCPPSRSVEPAAGGAT